MKSFDDEDFTTTGKRKSRCSNSTDSNETLFIEGNNFKKYQHYYNEGEKTRKNEVIHISDTECDDIDDSEFIIVYQII